ncbi:unnamed protein product [Parnassius apollo]|uniref:(apollo) hypothetical protein n=1 Tax=Parnassius apollo TaxID=110799 RepID=A0A8S3X1I6_PARAO|nr:unnamed protein product [Parnassius apollo]
MGFKLKIQQNQKCLKDTHYYVKQDFPKEVLKKRKELQPQLKVEREAGFLPLLFAERSSSQRSPPLEDDAAELFRDAPLYPPLRNDISSQENSDLTEQTHLTYDTETSIEENNLLVTPEESNLELQHNGLENIDVTNNFENSFENSENSVHTDIQELLFHDDSKEDENSLKSSFLNYHDVTSDVFEASRDTDENSENISFFTPIISKKANSNVYRKIWETKAYINNFTKKHETSENQNSIPKFFILTDKPKKYVESSILVAAESSDVNSENTILMTSDKNKEGEAGILLTPDINKTIKDSISKSDEVTVEDEDVSLVTTQESEKIAELNQNNNDRVKAINEYSETSQERVKRSQDRDTSPKTTSRRVKTGDTILNIRGAVRDAIGDAGAAPGPRPSTRLDAFVIRPEPAPRMPMSDEPRPDTDEPAPKPVTSPQKQERELLVAAHSYVRIPCDLVNVTNLRWYKDNEPAILSSTLPAAEGTGADGSLHIARAARPHAARWRCAGLDSKGRARAGRPPRLLIHEPVRSVYLAVDGRRLDAGNTWVPVRDKTVLEVRCVAEGGVPPPDLSWRLLALEPALDHRPYLRVYQTNSSIEGVHWSRAVVTVARELHNATLRCAATHRRAPPAAPPAAPTTVPTEASHEAPSTAPHAEYDELTAKLEIHVTYPPSFVISRWPGFGISLRAGGAAALRCDVDANPPARAYWLRDEDRPPSSPAPLEAAGPEARGSATLRWETLRESHGGWYRCRASWLDAEYSSIGYYLNVLSAEDPQSPSEVEANNEEPEHQKVDVPLGGNVQLHCPKGSVGCWWRRIVGNASETWAPAGSHHAHGVLGIRGALYQEAGEYRCVGARGADLQRMRDLKRVTLRVTGGATATALSASPTPGGWRLECGACGRGVRVLWLRAARAEPARLAPDAVPHCHRAVLHLPEPDEVWCAAVTASGGAVAVFPRRAAPAPARHAGRALPSSAHSHSRGHELLALLLLNSLSMYTLISMV